MTVAIISFTNYKRGQTTGCMGAVMRYTMQNKKTEFEGRQLVTGINCQPESVYVDFMTTKRLHHKTDGVLFYHMVQSFPKGEAVNPVTAHAAALKLAEYYEGYEVLVCTHTDREHIHSHFLINSVNFDTGKKLHIAKEQLQELRQRNDQVCMEFSLPVFTPTNRKEKTKTMSIGEYHTAARGQSKKLQLMNIINDCMRHASNREEFISLMESEGYKVRWEAEREAFFSARHQTAQTESAGHSMDQSAVGTGGSGADWAGAVGGVVQLGHALERSQGPAPVMDATTTHCHADSKALRFKNAVTQPDTVSAIEQTLLMAQDFENLNKPA